MKFKSTFYLLLVFLIASNVYSQEISVIYISGDAYTSRLVDGKEKYTKIVYGPIQNVEKVILKANAELRLVNGSNEIAELKGDTSIDLPDIMFKTVESNSVFSKFCAYFGTFFSEHSSAESKSYYQNNIYAISRGAGSAPSLDFPLAGVLPFDASQSLPFSWTHACDSCEYIVNIYNYATRSSVYAWTTDKHSVVLEKPENYLKPDTKYYWNVSISGEEMEYQNVIFTMASVDDYQNKVDQLNQELKTASVPISEATKAIYVMSDFENQGLMNYGIYYGLRQKEQHPENAEIADFLDRFWFDNLIEK